MMDATQARRIRLVVLDVDGVLTDGGIYLGAVQGQPLEFKRYDIQDGLGIALLQRAGVRVAIITGRVSDSVRLRAAELGIEDVAQVADARKLPAFTSLLQRHRIVAADAAWVGDDFADLPALRMAGISAAPAGAAPEVARECTVTLSRHGGHGAVREFVELLLRARGEWDATWESYLHERSVPAQATP